MDRLPRDYSRPPGRKNSFTVVEGILSQRKEKTPDVWTFAHDYRARSVERGFVEYGEYL